LGVLVLGWFLFFGPAPPPPPPPPLHTHTPPPPPPHVHTCTLNPPPHPHEGHAPTKPRAQPQTRIHSPTATNTTTAHPTTALPLTTQPATRAVQVVRAVVLNDTSDAECVRHHDRPRSRAGALHKPRILVVCDTLVRCSFRCSDCRSVQLSRLSFVTLLCVSHSAAVTVGVYSYLACRL
jgi:hypothetical protein